MGGLVMLYPSLINDFLSTLHRGEVTCGGHTAHEEYTLSLLILQRESSWCFLYAIKSNVD